MSNPATGPVAEKSIFKVAVVALAGSSIEWYDFFIYGIAAALVFPNLFFPYDTPPLIAQLAAFSTFAVGFVARPIGGAVFGHIGDRVGRKTALVIALLMMGSATTLIGILPSYASIGWAAPVALVVLRFVQGLAIGGQWGGAVLLATESAPKSQRGFYGSFAQVGVPVGVVTANLVYLLVSAAVTPAAFADWGWRVPFLASIGLVMLGLYIQFRLEETPSFRLLREAKAQRDETVARQLAEQNNVSLEKARAEIAAERESSPIIEVLKTYPKEIALTAGAFVASNANFYIFITFIISYGTGTLELPQNLMLTAVLIGSVLMVPALLGFAAFSDRFGRRGIFMAGATLTGLWAFFFFPLIETGSFILVTTAVSIGLFLLSMMYGPQAAFFAETFATKVRYSGASLGYQLGAILGGGLAPLIATALFAKFLSSVSIAIYMAALCVVSLISAFMMTDTYKSELDEANSSEDTNQCSREMSA